MKRKIAFLILPLIISLQPQVMAGLKQDCIDTVRQTACNLSYVASGLTAAGGAVCLGVMGYLALHRTPNGMSSAARVRSILQTLEDLGVPEINANLLQFNGRHLAALGITGTACLILAALFWPSSNAHLQKKS